MLLHSLFRHAFATTFIVILLATITSLGRAWQSVQGEVLSVDPANRSESLAFFRSDYQAYEVVSAGWTGNVAGCVAGETSAEFQQAVLRRINYYRAMAGINTTVTFSPTYSAKAQQAALITSANNSANHFPADTATCYSEDGYDGAFRSLLALGSFGWSAIDDYMRDAGASNYAIGHRRWLLIPQLTIMGTGDIPSGSGAPPANAVWVNDMSAYSVRPATRHEFVAWPPPGHVPYPVVFARWSFAYPNANFSAATVTMERAGSSVAVQQETVENGTGENTLVWKPLGLSDGATWPRPTTDITYTVTINNVGISGVSRTFTYDVIIIDINNPPSNLRLTGSTLLENRPIGTNIGTLSASDPDSGDSLVYSLVAGPGDSDNAFFSIIGNRLRSNAIFDFESRTTYSVRIQVSDQRAGGVLAQSFTITINDVLDTQTATPTLTPRPSATPSTTSTQPNNPVPTATASATQPKPTTPLPATPTATGTQTRLPEDQSPTPSSTGSVLATPTATQPGATSQPNPTLPPASTETQTPVVGTQTPTPSTTTTVTTPPAITPPATPIAPGAAGEQRVFLPVVIRS